LMSEAGGHPLASLLKEKFDGNFYPLRKDIVSTLAVYTYLKEVKELGRFRTNDIAKALEFIGGEKLEQVPIKLSAETKRMTLFIIRNQLLKMIVLNIFEVIFVLRKIVKKLLMVWIMFLCVLQILQVLRLWLLLH